MSAGERPIQDRSKDQAPPKVWLARLSLLVNFLPKNLNYKAILIHTYYTIYSESIVSRICADTRVLNVLNSGRKDFFLTEFTLFLSEPSDFNASA